MSRAPFRRPPPSTRESVGPVATANAGPHMGPFGHLLRRRDLEADLETLRRDAASYISGGAVLPPDFDDDDDE